MSIKNDIQSIIAKSGWTLTDLAREISIKYESNLSVQTLSKRICRESIRYSDIIQLAEIIGYEIKWVKKETDD